LGIAVTNDRYLAVSGRSRTVKINVQERPEAAIQTGGREIKLATGTPITSSILLGFFAFRQVIEKRHLIPTGTFAVVGIETLTGFPIRASFLFNTFLNVFCPDDNEFLLPGGFASRIQFSLLHIRVLRRSIGVTVGRNEQ
jgi:hypothetical protein